MKNVFLITAMLVSPALQALASSNHVAVPLQFICTQPPKEGGKQIAVVSLYPDGSTKINLGHLMAYGQYQAQHGDCPSRLCGYLMVRAQYGGPAKIDLSIYDQGIIKNGHLSVKYNSGKTSAAQEHTLICQ